jgi:hypothetical protein
VTVNPPKQIARFATCGQPYWLVTSKDGQTVFLACPGSDEVIAFDVAAKREKWRLQFPARQQPTRMLVVAAPRSAPTATGGH